jgi:capsular polysaccharide biosynthesis protein
MINFIKRLYLILFTRNPYKIISFRSLVKPKIGEPVGVRDTLTNILIEEKGDLIFYPPLPKSYDNVLTEQNANRDTPYRTGTIYREETRFLYSLDSGYIIGLFGLIYDKSKRAFIDESAKLWTENLSASHHMYQYKQPEAKFLPGVSLSCATIGADGGFYHFFYEVLTKLYFCREILPRTDHILMCGPAAEWKEKWLRHIGIDLTKIIWLNADSHFMCDQLLFTNRLINNQHISNWSLDAVKSLLKIDSALPASTQQEIIWITRKNVFARTIAWEDELLSQFPAIKKVDIRDFSVIDTIQLFENATHVISPHGAGLCNIIMCRPKTKILELYPDIAGYQPCYFRISTLSGLEHFVAEVDFNKKTGMEKCAGYLTDFLAQAVKPEINYQAYN